MQILDVKDVVLGGLDVVWWWFEVVWELAWQVNIIKTFLNFSFNY